MRKYAFYAEEARPPDYERPPPRKTRQRTRRSKRQSPGRRAGRRRVLRTRGVRRRSSLSKTRNRLPSRTLRSARARTRRLLKRPTRRARLLRARRSSLLRRTLRRRKRPRWWWRKRRYPYWRTRAVYVMPYDPRLPYARRAERLPSTFSAAAKASLKRHELDTSAWRARLRTARLPLRRFINRFHSVPGFHHVVRAAYGNARQRRLAKLAVRAASQLGKRAENRKDLRFEASTGLTLSGEVTPGIDLVDALGGRYRLLPWTRFRASLLVRLINSDRALHRRPLTYLFDGDGVTASKQTLVKRTRRAWRERFGGVRPWPSEVDIVALT